MVDCLISVRTKGEVSTPISLKVYEAAPDWAALAALDPDLLLIIVQASTYPEQKAATLQRVARLVLERHQGNLPLIYQALIALPGIGPKCANAVLAIVGGQPTITVDTHVRRVVERWGVVRGTAEQMIQPLQTWIPKPHWDDLNRLVQPFGKHICVWDKPKCDRCPLTGYCDWYKKYRIQRQSL